MKRNDSGQRGHFHLGRIARRQCQLPGNAPDIVQAAFEINVLAGERLEWFEFRFGGQIPFRPEIHRLPADEDVRLSGRVAYPENVGKLVKGKTHGQAQRDMARVTSLKLVMRHFAALPNNEARR